MISAGVRGAALSVAGLWGVLQAGCVADVCGQVCGAEGECPSGFVCGESGVCSPIDEPDACELDREGEPLYGEGGTSGGSAGSGAGGSSSGAAGSGGAGPEALAIAVLERPELACTGGQVTIRLGAAGGSGGYAWRLIDPPAGFGAEAQGAELFISGAPAAAGPIELQVELSDGDEVVQAPVSLVVREAPRVLTRALPAVCPGEVYAAPLAAEGGAAESYAWQVEGAPAGSGLALDGGRLVGHFQGSSGPLELALSVGDGACQSETVVASLEVLSAGSELCPAIRVVGGDLAAELPPPCLGGEYAQGLDVVQANAAGASYEWRELEAAPGLGLDAATATLSGSALGAGVASVQVTDSRGRSIRRDLAVEPRQSCWFAYITREPGPARLRLLDGRLAEQPGARRAFPEADAGSVLDFSFSPEGRFLAYRVQEGEGAARLRLLDLRTWQDTELELEGSVTAHAWADAGGAESVLAAAFSDGAVELLGGAALDWSREPEDLLEPAALRYLEPAPASVRSGLFWVDPARVGFLAQDPLFELGRLLQTARVDGEGFEALDVREALEFFDGARFARATGGVFVIEPSTGSPVFFPSDGTTEVLHGAGMVVAPSGAFTARASGGELLLFRAADASFLQTSPAWARAPGCTSLLAWASGRERLACARAAGEQAELVFFDLPDRAEPVLLELDRVQGDYELLQGQHINQPRSFAPGGERFAFATEGGARVVRLDAGTPRVEVDAPASMLGAPPGRLSFSPRGTFFAVHAGPRLLVWNFGQANNPFGRLVSSVAPPEPCGEAFELSSPPWCGSAPADADTLVRWSPGEDLLAVRTASGGLELEDLTLGFPADTRTVVVEESCQLDCVDPRAYAFQP